VKDESEGDILADFNEEVSMGKKVMKEEGIKSSDADELINEARSGLKESK